MNSIPHGDASIARRGLQYIAAPLLVALAGFLAYSNSFQGVFLLDDESMIVDNPTIRSLTPASKFFFEGGLRKLPMFSFAANYAMSGLDPAGYHYFNVIVHLLAAVCLYGLAFVTFSSPVWAAEQRAKAALIAFLISLLWVVHPLNTQAVDYIVQRIESMMGLAFFLFLLIYASSHYAKHPRILLIVAWFVFCAGLLCKEVMAMSLPVAMLYDRAILSVSWREAFRSRGLFWFACAFPLALAAVFIIPVMQHAREDIHVVATRKCVNEHVTAHDFNTLGDAGTVQHCAGLLDDTGKIEKHSPKTRNEVEYVA